MNRIRAAGTRLEELKKYLPEVLKKYKPEVLEKSGWGSLGAAVDKPGQKRDRRRREKHPPLDHPSGPRRNPGGRRPGGECAGGLGAAPTRAKA